MGNEAMVEALLEMLHDTDRSVRGRAAELLGHLGVGNEAMVNVLLERLHTINKSVREGAVHNLGRIEVKDKIQLHQILVALNRCLYDLDIHFMEYEVYIRSTAL